MGEGFGDEAGHGEAGCSDAAGIFFVGWEAVLRRCRSVRVIEAGEERQRSQMGSRGKKGVDICRDGVLRGRWVK